MLKNSYTIKDKYIIENSEKLNTNVIAFVLKNITSKKTQAYLSFINLKIYFLQYTIKII